MLFVTALHFIKNYYKKKKYFSMKNAIFMQMHAKKTPNYVTTVQYINILFSTSNSKQSKANKSVFATCLSLLLLFICYTICNVNTF